MKIDVLDHDDIKLDRVQRFLQWKNQLLHSAADLCKIIGHSVAHVADCEQSRYFFETTIQPMFVEYKEKAKSKGSIPSYPFKKFKTDSGIVFGESSKEITLKIAESHFEEIKQLFQDIESMRPLELLKQDSDRSTYLLLRETRVVLMTAAVACIRRKELARLGFKYDNLIIDESEKLLEIESLGFIMNVNLQTIVLCGDHRLIAAKVKNTVCANNGRLGKSLLLRLIENGYPAIELNTQFGVRQEIMNIYRFLYPNLAEMIEPKLANAGMAKTVQFINVENYKGIGETSPHSEFYQNLGEAEFAIATFMFLRLVG